MTNEIWHWNGTAFDKSPKDILEQLLKDNKANYDKAVIAHSGRIPNSSSPRQETRSALPKFLR